MSLRSLILSLTFTAACSTTPSHDPAATPGELCTDVVTELCGQLFSCLSSTERAAQGLPSTEAACVTQSASRKGCATLSAANACPAGKAYQPSQAAACADQVAALSCNQVRTGGAVELVAPACGQVCK